jgi:hypothetical protein
MVGTAFCSVFRGARLVLRMKEDQHRFLSLLGQLPFRLSAEQAGWVLNCQPHDIPALIYARLLKPLDNPPANGRSIFPPQTVLETTTDRSRLVKMATAINTRWQKQNAKKCNGYETLGTSNGKD